MVTVPLQWMSDCHQAVIGDRYTLCPERVVGGPGGGVQHTVLPPV